MDCFVFDTGITTGDRDVVHDFTHGTDKIVLDRSVFNGLQVGNLSNGAFVKGPKALDADDRIIVDAATDRVMYDADGIGEVDAVTFALCDPVNVTYLSASDFLII